MQRPSSQQRPSLNSTASSLPRSSSNRNSYSGSLAVPNPAHRVTRRKSTSTVPAVPAAAIAAALDAGRDLVEAAAAKSVNRRSLPRAGAGPRRGSFAASPPVVPYSLPSNGAAFASTNHALKSESAVVDGPALATVLEDDKAKPKARARRSSDGTSALSKGESKRAGNGELRCETCGKGYKHSSCLAKHLSVALDPVLHPVFTLRTPLPVL